MHLCLTNATLVLPDRILHGTLHATGGRITDIAPGTTQSGQNLDGDFLIPGAIDLHTDNLERQVQPRQNARWPSRAAFLAHDAQCAAAGITTVLDALCVGNAGLDDDRPRTCTEGIADLDALNATGLLKADHYLHLRCELPAIGMLDQLEPLATHPALRMVSLMDHTPGIGQFNDLPRYRAMLAREGVTQTEIDRTIATLQDQRARLRTPNRGALLARLRHLPVALASHDDATPADIAENLADSIAIAEFPVTLAAAAAARAAGMAIIAGAPNLVRGGSHSGNISAATLLAASLIDALASDYVPSSLIHAAFLAGPDLPAAIALITTTPARLAALPDRGALSPGLRADVVRVRVHDGIPVVREVWKAGERVI